jgi:phosphatidylglycerol:prolipoprotein diacylglycerol transferase
VCGLHGSTASAIVPASAKADSQGDNIHFPLYVSLGRYSLPAHFLFEALAYAIGFWAYRRLRKSSGDAVSDDSRWSVITAAVAGAAIGSRVLFWFEDPRLTAAHWHDAVYLLSGKTIVGGLIGGLIAVECVKRIIGEKVSTGDLFAAPIALGLAIGRIGCFLGGLSDDTYGTPTSLPWGIDFGDGVPRHPTQLYESIFALGLFFFLRRMMKRPHRNGDVFKAFMVAYMAWRLAIDYWKPEFRMAGLSGLQWACAATLVYYLRDISRWVQGRAPALPAGDPAATDDSPTAQRLS